MSASIHALNMYARPVTFRVYTVVVLTLYARRSLQAVLTKAEHLGGTRKRDRLMAVLRPHSLGKEIAELQTCLDDAEQQFHVGLTFLYSEFSVLISFRPHSSRRK